MLKQITLESNNRFTSLIIGQAGIGKTSLLRTIPENEPVCVVSAESGLLCVRDLVESKRVQGFVVETFADLSEIFKYLQTDGKSYFKWIFIDSLTEIASKCLEALKIKFPDRKDSFPMWGEYADKMTSLIKAYRDIPDYNVVFTCLTSMEKDDLNRVYMGPSISSGALKERLPGYFDEVLYMVSLPDTEGKEKRAFLTQPWEKYPAKDRSGKLPLVEVPSLQVIKQKIMGS